MFRCKPKTFDVLNFFHGTSVGAGLPKSIITSWCILEGALKYAHWHSAHLSPFDQYCSTLVASAQIILSLEMLKFS